MPSLTIKNITDELYLELKNAAKQHHRSINSEVIICLKQALLPRQIPPQQRLNDIRALRAQIPPNAVTESDIENAINEGRP